MSKKEQAQLKRKKLSWIYKKKKFEKAKLLEKTLNSNSSSNKNARIVLRNLSFKVKEDDISKLYQPYGQIEEVNLLRHPDGTSMGCCFVQFKEVPDASKAIYNTNKKEFFGRAIIADWAIPKSKFVQKLQQVNSSEGQSTNEIKPPVDSTINEVEVKEETNVTAESKSDNSALTKKKLKAGSIKKRGRIVIRNLPYKITEDKLKETFSKYGEVEEIKFLTKEDGKLMGVAFLQFSRVQSATKAIHYTNLQQLEGRTIVVDWAVPKKKFVAKNSVKTETDSNDVKPVIDLEEEVDNKDNTLNDIKVEKEIEEDGSEESLLDEHLEEEKFDNEESEDEKSQIKFSRSRDNADNKNRPSDVNEGRTVFLKNVPFSVKNDELKEYVEKFGPVFYALVCMDPLTEHSRGTAFVKFRNVQDAEKMLHAGSELKMHDQIIEACKALEKKDLDDIHSNKKQKVKDSRNLYLVKEGVVFAGSPAARDVSAADMSKRLQLENWKSQILKNLNMFVSRVRLVVHNLPPTVDDTRLRQIFKKHSGSKAVIREARVMRDLKNLDEHGVAKSKEYGFVTFTTLEDALHALRSINNNPNVFSKHRRPIVGFSVENRVMVKAKERRVQKSREKNPLWQDRNLKRKGEDKTGDRVPSKVQKLRKEDDNSSFAGTTGKPGEKKLRSKSKLKAQAELHSKVRKERKQKTVKKFERVKGQISEKVVADIPESTVKVKKITKRAQKLKEDTDFGKLVNNYKSKLAEYGQTRTKWFEN
ncbi:RNA-binding protein 28 [Prorops nasuta]|uniref:RNA-binding protein 28 n=1 Tax=Prorops nasuta TaxID=863751 RepID=UPI0034CD2967